MKKSLFLIALFVCAVLSAQEWSPAGDHIMTPWGEALDPAAVHQEYPRPQLVRSDWKCLNGLWDYAVTGKDDIKPSTFEGKILVPFGIESALSGVGRVFNEDDALWYETTVSIPSSWRAKGKAVLLNFEAVDWSAEVYVNDKFVGSHTGAYTHFSFDITSYLKGGKAKITVRVIDGTNNDFQPRGKQVKSPGGIWYTADSGIWQTVWMESVSSTYVKDYYAVSDIDAKTLTIYTDVENVQEGDELYIALSNGDSKYECAVSDRAPVILDVPDMKLWSPDDPQLYDINFILSRKGKVLDKVQGYTAMRKISIVEDSYGRRRLALNNEALFQFGPLDQGWWPDGLHTAPSDEALRYDIQKTKDFGFNMIRKHIKVEPSRWYYWCDVLGMMVWQDMPSFDDNTKNSWGTHYYGEGTDTPVSDEAKANYYKEWSEIIAQQKKFQCIVVWVPFNEAWSQFDTKAVVEYTRSLDPTRPINQSSGGNWEKGVGDILDIHHYPEPRMVFWDPEMVNVLGEYGGIGFPVEGHLWQADKNWGYVKYQSGADVLKEYENFAQKLIKLNKFGCAAAVYTQTTDVEIEVNGLMTYDRKFIKMDETRLREINQSVINWDK